jgi:hypothetical protein
MKSGAMSGRAVGRNSTPVRTAAHALARCVLVAGLVVWAAWCSRSPPRLDWGPSDAADVSAAPVGIDSGAPASSSASRRAPSPPAGPTDANAPAAGAHSSDGGSASCRIVRGPVELPMRGAVSLVVRGGIVDALLNDDGRARTVAFPAGPIPPPAAIAAREPVTEEIHPALGVPCASTTDWDFCPDRSGSVHRNPPSGGADRVVASSRPGTRIAVASLAGSHAVLAYLASRQTSEGWVSEAWAELDDDAPARLSEDGSGATSVALAAQGSALVALTVDARTALTAMHARPIRYDRGLRLGEDVVAFVGGPGDRRTAAALAGCHDGSLVGLLPISKDVGAFGLALVKLDDPPRVDEPVTWAMYPNGLDPAPVAAASGRGRTWVARIRPHGSEPGSPREIEVGALVDAPSLSSPTILDTSGTPSDVAIAVDAAGALWVSWLDSTGSWLERLACR